MGSVSGECPPENFLDIGFEEFLEVAATALNLALNRKYLINAQFIIINDSLQASTEQQTSDFTADGAIWYLLCSIMNFEVHEAECR